MKDHSRCWRSSLLSHIDLNYRRNGRCMIPSMQLCLRCIKKTTFMDVSVHHFFTCQTSKPCPSGHGFDAWHVHHLPIPQTSKPCPDGHSFDVRHLSTIPNIKTVPIW